MAGPGPFGERCFPGLHFAMPSITRRDALAATATGLAALALPRLAFGADDRSAIYAEIVKRHDEALERLQEWIRHPSIAAESRASEEGCELMMQLARRRRLPARRRGSRPTASRASSRRSTPARSGRSGSTSCTT